MKEEYYLTYNSGCGVSAYTGNDKTPFHVDDTPVKFPNIKAAKEVLKQILAAYGLNKAAERHFNIIPTTNAAHVINAR